VTSNYFRYKSRTYVKGRTLDIDPEDFNSTFMIKVEEPKPIEPTIVLINNNPETKPLEQEEPVVEPETVPSQEEPSDAN
jgi:hypothetical protein